MSNIQLIVNGPDSKSLHDTVVITPDIAQQIVALAQAQPAQPSDSVCSLCGGTQKECQHRRCYGYVNGQRTARAVAQPSGDDAAAIIERIINKVAPTDVPMGDAAQTILAAIRANPWTFLDKEKLTGYYLEELRAKLASAHACVQSQDCIADAKDAELAALRERLERVEKLYQCDRSAMECMCEDPVDRVVKDRDIARAEADAAKAKAAALKQSLISWASGLRERAKTRREKCGQDGLTIQFERDSGMAMELLRAAGVQVVES